MSRPIVAIVGRPNVGKSTLFNRLLGERRAIVDELPGTTRDRLYANISWEGCELTLVDTGGLETKPDSSLQERIKEQVEVALREADAILFLVDIQEGVMPSDLEIADILRRSEKPMMVVANKVDSPKQQSELYQFYKLGIGEPLPISAYHGKGVNELLNKVISCLPLPPPAPVELEIMKVAIVGRPNVGKSMLLNSILGEERVIVNKSPGTTRDAIDTLFCYNGESVILIDTAGIRKRGKVGEGVERYSVMRALRAIDRADIALLVTDATEGIIAQDAHILGYILQSYKGIVLIVNKWDLVEVKSQTKWIEAIRERLRFTPYIPILFTSAKAGHGVEGVIPTARRVYEERQKRLPAPLLNNLIKEAVVAHPGSKQLKISSATQTGVNPPTFEILVNDAKLVHFSYQRYLENRLRQAFGFEGTPLRLQFKSRGEKQYGA